MKTQSEDQGEGEGGTREDRERGREREREDERSKRRNETGRKNFLFATTQSIQSAERRDTHDLETRTKRKERITLPNNVCVQSCVSVCVCVSVSLCVRESRPHTSRT